jgi:hypothetical protein
MTPLTRNVLAALLFIFAGTGVTRSGEAGTDEAWLHRATVPPGSRPLLAVILDRSRRLLASSRAGRI